MELTEIQSTLEGLILLHGKDLVKQGILTYFAESEFPEFQGLLQENEYFANKIQLLKEELKRNGSSTIANESSTIHVCSCKSSGACGTDYSSNPS